MDLVKETQDLQARVEPMVGDSLSSVLAVIVNPVWGLGALIVQKIFRNPLGQAFTFDYRVTGTWTDPKVDRVKADVRVAETRQEPALP